MKIPVNVVVHELMIVHQNGFKDVQNSKIFKLKKQKNKKFKMKKQMD